MGRYIGAFVGLALVIAALGTSTGGHTAINSRFTYNEHLFPIFQRQCGSCHAAGGVAPMSLLTYQEAFPWTQSIREEVLGLRMPPWKAEDGFGDFVNGHVLPAHELDMILEWAGGGYPEGPRDQRPAAPEPVSGWTLGSPTVELTVPDPFSIDAATSEAVRFFTLPTSFTEGRWVTGVDVRPGSRAIVRHVAVYVDTTGQARGLADADTTGPGFAAGFDGVEPIAVWWPGQSVVRLDGAGYALPAGADVVARIVYKKTWITEGQAFTDQTSLGLHLAEEAVATIAHTVVSSPAEPSGPEFVFSYPVDDAITLRALLPEMEIEALELQVEAVLPDGSSQPLLLIREPDPGWPTRYVFDTPHLLPGGSQIQVTATLPAGAERESVPSLFSSGAPVRLLVDYTSGAVLAN